MKIKLKTNCESNGRLLRKGLVLDVYDRKGKWYVCGNNDLGYVCVARELAEVVDDELDYRPYRKN